MPRISRGVLVAVALAMVPVSACTTTPPAPPQTVISWPEGTTGGYVPLLVGSGSTLYAVWGNRMAVISGPQGSPVVSAVPASRDGSAGIGGNPRGLAVDTIGAVWLVQADQRVTTPDGSKHPAVTRLLALGEGSVTLSSGRVVSDRLVAQEGLAVVDGSTVLASTFTGLRAENNAVDVLLNQVTATGHTEVAGRWRTEPEQPLARVPEGALVPATAVDLGVVRGVAALTQGRAVITVGNPPEPSNPHPRLSIAVLEGATLRRLPLLALCPTEGDVSLVRVSDRLVLIGAPAPKAGGECPRVPAMRTWLRIDVTDGSSTILATDTENLAIVGDRIITARTQGSSASWTTTITWLP